jgi:hypothetical protein
MSHGPYNGSGVSFVSSAEINKNASGTLHGYIEWGSLTMATVVVVVVVVVVVALV